MESEREKWRPLLVRLEYLSLCNPVDEEVKSSSTFYRAAWSVRDDAVLIDLGKFKNIQIDEEKMIAYVSPSTTGRMLNSELEKRNLIFCGGHCPDVGLGGFLLQGGMGWNCRVNILHLMSPRVEESTTNKAYRTGVGHASK